VAPSADLLRGSQAVAGLLDAPETWNPERSPSGPVSIVISAADRRVVVLRNGVPIGSAPVTIDSEIDRTFAFVMGRDDAQGRTWLRIPLPGQSADEASEELRGRIHVSETFRSAVLSALAPGATVVVTNDSLRTGGTGQALTVAEGEAESEQQRSSTVLEAARETDRPNNHPDPGIRHCPRGACRSEWMLAHRRKP
jgi:hypothetical protein